MIRKIRTRLGEFKLKANDVQTLIFLPAFLLLLTLHDGRDAFYHQRAGLMLFIALCVGIYFGKIYGWLTGLLFGYCLASAVWAGYPRNNKFLILGQAQGVIQYYVCLGSLSTLAIWVTVANEVIKRKVMAYLWLSFGAFICFHYTFLRNVFCFDGFIMTPTVAGVFLALMIPTALRYAPAMLLVLVPYALVMGNITAWATVGAFAFGYYLVKRPRNGVLIAIPCLLIASWLAYRQYTGPWGLGQHRFQVWEAMFQWFNAKGMTLLGMGAGSGYVLTPLVQSAKEVFAGEGYVYLHNEPLQALIELGWVGVLLISAVTATLFRFLYKSRNARGIGFMFALFVASLSMFPFRHETFLFLTVWSLHEFMDAKVFEQKFKLAFRSWIKNK